MDLDLKTSTTSLRLPSKPSSLLVTSPTRQGKLPPISSVQTNGGPDASIDGQLTEILLEQSKGEVEESMRHLLSEVLLYCMIIIILLYCLQCMHCTMLYCGHGPACNASLSH